jgi:hypothetical protein
VQDGALLITVAQLAQRVAEGPVQVEHTRRFYFDGKFAYQRQWHYRHAVCLNLTWSSPFYLLRVKHTRSERCDGKSVQRRISGLFDTFAAIASFGALLESLQRILDASLECFAAECFECPSSPT